VFIKSQTKVCVTKQVFLDGIKLVPVFFLILSAKNTMEPNASPSFRDPKEFFNRLNLIYYAICSAPLLFFFFSYLNYKKNPPQSFDNELIETLNYLVPTAAALITWLAYQLYLSFVRKSRKADKLAHKLAGFQTAKIIQWACLEAASLLAAVAYFLTAYPVFALWFALMFLVLAFNRPNIEVAVKILRLSADESKALQENKSFTTF
jgi:ABC-type multidrug transport system permease subunit